MTLKVIEVSKTYRSVAEDVSAVRSVSFSVAKGKMLCIRGPSGGGKSTLLNIIGGVTEPDMGQVWVEGESVWELQPAQRVRLRRTVVGMVFQEPVLIAEFKAWENVALPLELETIGSSDIRDRAMDALSMVGLVGGISDRYPHQMSGGQRQRVAIARALVGGCQLLLADEPTGALDTRNARALFELITDLCENSGLAAVVASHDPECANWAHETIEIVDGQLRHSVDS